MFMEDTVQFQRLLRNVDNRKEISTTLNEYSQNLLHLVCHLNEQTEYIHIFYHLKCSVFKQDFYGRTPLHVALQKCHRECINEFVIILNAWIDFKSNGKDNTNVDNEDKLEYIENLKKMFRIYDHDGYTVLHLAVLKNLPEVVHVMLRFCLNFKINILEHEVLGSGDSILHLAVKNNFKNIADDIVEMVKGSENFPNYGGLLPYVYNNYNND